MTWSDPPSRPALTPFQGDPSLPATAAGRLGHGPSRPEGAGEPASDPLAPPRTRRAVIAGVVVAAVLVGGGVSALGLLAGPDARVDPGQASAALPTADVPALLPPPRVARVVHRRVPITWPFGPPPGLRRPRPGELATTLFADGRMCSVGCRPFGAVDAWPLAPFHRQHPLRAGLNELRGSGFHVGIDIQARDGARVVALQAGTVRILAATGPDARVQVGNYIYWHVHPTLAPGTAVTPLSQVLGTVLPGFGHLHLSEVDAAGDYLNPLRPQGRVLTPWTDTEPPVIGHPRIGPSGQVEVAAFDPQSDVAFTTYQTPVLAPAGLAYRLFDPRGRALTPLEWALRGTGHLPIGDLPLIYAGDSSAPGYDCFTARLVCVPRWDYRLAGGLAPPLPLGLPAGPYRLTTYAFDWAGNVSALDQRLRLSVAGWEPQGRLDAPIAPVVARSAGGESAGVGSARHGPGSYRPTLG